MISCTEFIPLYSEFFKYLEKHHGGKDAVMKYWIHISDTSIGDKTNPNSLAYKCDRLGGYGGACAYWGHTLTEEACDLFELNDAENEIRYTHMRHCPSRGMLNALSHVEPYRDYCEHCNVIYSRVLENYGFTYVRDDSMVDNAECKSILYRTGHEPSFDFKAESDESVRQKCSENSEVVDLKSEDNKYLHRDFHLLGDNALKYCRDTYGEEDMKEFLTEFTVNYFAPVIDKAKKNGLSALYEHLWSVYEKEEASELLHLALRDDELTVEIDECPAIRYMHTLEKEPSECYVEETRTVYSTMAKAIGLDFELHYYEKNGKAKFTFRRHK